jgi:hypothetical protein
MKMETVPNILLKIGVNQRNTCTVADFHLKMSVESRNISFFCFFNLNTWQKENLRHSILKQTKLHDPCKI